jgi:hypothetical protein
MIFYLLTYESLEKADAFKVTELMLGFWSRGCQVVMCWV